MIDLCDGPIDVRAVRRSVDDPSCGAILVFEGVSRDNFDGKRVLRLSYQAYAPLVMQCFAEIQREAITRWPGINLAIVHRTGEVAIGEPSVVIATSAPHRHECYAVSRFAIDALKERAPIWKQEVYEDGSAWKANAPS